MRILVINGSPKGERSNTWQLTQAFLDGIAEQLGADGIEQRTVVVRDSNIQPCLGCFSCWRNEKGACCLKDDMQSIISDRTWADVTIWSFPLYYFGVPGPLKNLIDRQLPMALPFMEERTDGVGNGSHPSRYNMADKRNVIISTCGFYTAKGNYDSVLTQFDHMCGKGNYETVLCGQGELFRVPELHERTDAYLEVVRRAGSEFARGTIAPDTRKELGQLLYPRQAFEAMADASWGISRETGKAEDETIVFTRQMAALYNPASFDGAERVLEMDYTDRGTSCCVVLGKDSATVVTDGSVTPTTSIHTPYDVWRDIAQGKISGTDALAQHLYRVTGDFDLMIRWGEIFGDPNGGADSPESSTDGSGLKPPVMLAMLIPWIAFWTTMSIGPMVGAVGTIVACAVTALAFCQHEHTFYDYLSLACVLALVAASVAGVPFSVLSPVSFVAFGLMWLVSALWFVPVSSYYVKGSYGGDSALGNAIFIDTNRIICLVWGVTYLAAAVVSFFAPQITIVTSQLLPIPAAIFTVVFQRWYPAHVARG
ncbi:MAG: flavodoxin family protein [Atopobiaceae bacterium]|nr:flavodoxin family protein [Atopobiaceae bacterium]